jgi:GNAT superfamily N-acetyltransferase
MEFVNEPCPWLPPVERRVDASLVNGFEREERGAAFYLASLRYGQSLWRSGFPAQALLQCNRAFSVPLAGGDAALAAWPLPYMAMAWLMARRPEDQFIGNPRRHFQHLATRMVEPWKELRAARAWACWRLAVELLPESEFPADWRQIRREGVVEPPTERVRERLLELSPANDAAVWEDALRWCSAQRVGGAQTPVAEATDVSLRVIGPDEAPAVADLAHTIWRAYYPGIISDRQIDHMLGLWYTEEALRREISSGAAEYALIQHGARAAGYVAHETSDGVAVLFIGKLYVLPELHGAGLGRRALEWLVRRAGEKGSGALRLRVNKQNHRAIRSYLRAGFTFVEDIVTDIGAGFVMDDFVMERRL